MVGEFKNILKVACIYMATIIGAGFASGQEIVQFFSSYYKGGFYGIVLAGVLFSVIGYIVLDKVYTERIRNYDEFLFPTVGYPFGRVMEVIVMLFMLCVFCIMLAGLGNLLMDKFALPFKYGVLLMAFVCMAAILSDIKGIVSLSTVISPVLIIGILVVGFYIIITKDTSVFSISGSMKKITDNWFFSALIYVSYNSLISTVVMCSLLPYLKTRKVGIAGGILGGLLLCFAALILNAALFIFYPGFLGNELPVLSIIEKRSNILSEVYSIILWLAMFVSAVTSGYCFVDRAKNKVPVNIKLLTVITCIMAIPLAGMGFSNLIASAYPLFGYAGLFMIFVIIIQWMRTPFLKKSNK
ncbi:MAG: hypothetical protein N3B21_03980 [Clostridia bacterium]|nr:hypothetical protein [Clostridia bacterium]